jgi:hypothetical protein
MEAITALLESRCSRANLDTTKNYIKVKKMNGKVVEEDVGQFVRAYRMGSGDGMTIHWEFLKDGVTIVIDDAMWGSIEGSELVGFKEK